MSTHKRRIAARFGAAATDYDAASPVQRDAAARLAERVAALPLPSAPRVLEIGCGTGHLTRALLPRIGGDWVVTDIAPAMVAECRRQATQACRWLAMDGESPALAAGRFDLIVSSLAMQWFADLPAALERLMPLLAPGGRLVIATLGDGTFAEWHEAHRRLGLSAATLRFPAMDDFARAFPRSAQVTLAEDLLTAPVIEPLAFVRGLRAIGADTPLPGSKPLPAGQMRRVLGEFSALATDGVSYHLLFAEACNIG